jgi:hypothetical protein
MPFFPGPVFTRCLLRLFAFCSVMQKYTLTHWSIRAKGDQMDHYVADIYHICILGSPILGGPATPKRKRVLRTDPLTPDLSPMKKLKHSS